MCTRIKTFTVKFYNDTHWKFYNETHWKCVVKAYCQTSAKNHLIIYNLIVL